MMKMKCALPAALLLALAAGEARAAQCNLYDAGSTSGSICVSCKDFSVTTAGVFSATCNKATGGSGTSGQTITTHTPTLDLDDYVGCSSAKTLQWESSGDFSDELESSTSPSMQIASSGQHVELKATCDGGSASTLNVDTCIQSNGMVGQGFAYQSTLSGC